MEERREWPKFRYHPNLYSSGVVVFEDAVCQCCGEKAYIASMYCAERVNCICPSCVASGKAAEKLHGEFIQDVEEVRPKPTSSSIGCPVISAGRESIGWPAVTMTARIWGQ